ncbi:flagellar hook-length control protein FliK [Chitinilyticum litopenaei]|uniref:flagellar hook-length control protein FliK n=1 Tax=Chitinilyticum litopenaei TaxID=1121276 RepID=UPI000401842A|nr:flagellar hook-length control protein FliK [Chitinilyticum litopenaei]
MLPGNTPVSLVQNYLRVQQGVIETVRQPETTALLLTVGERVSATVQGLLPNGRFAVLVKDQLLDMNLPRNTQPGTQLDLTVLEADEQIRFALEQKPAAQPQSAGTPVSLSGAAQRLQDLLARLPGGESKVVLSRAEPLFSGPPDTAKLAGQLAASLGESGLFYESHQAQWVKGERSLPQILREPQALLSLAQAATAQDAAASAGKPAAGMGLTALLNQIAEVVRNPQEADAGPDVQQTPESKAPPGAGTAERPAAAAPQTQAERELDMNRVSNELAGRQLLDALGGKAEGKDGELAMQQLRQLVQQQLDLADQRPLHWQGQAWPEQKLDWSLSWERDAQEADNPDASERRWTSRMELDMPQLGKVSILLTLQGQQFAVRFAPEVSATSATLASHLDVLTARFSAAGLELAQALVERQESAG